MIHQASEENKEGLPQEKQQTAHAAECVSKLCLEEVSRSIACTNAELVAALSETGSSNQLPKSHIEPESKREDTLGSSISIRNFTKTGK